AQQSLRPRLLFGREFRVLRWRVSGSLMLPSRVRRISKPPYCGDIRVGHPISSTYVAAIWTFMVLKSTLCHALRDGTVNRVVVLFTNNHRLCGLRRVRIGSFDNRRVTEPIELAHTSLTR